MTAKLSKKVSLYSWLYVSKKPSTDVPNPNSLSSWPICKSHIVSLFMMQYCTEGCWGIMEHYWSVLFHQIIPGYTCTSPLMQCRSSSNPVSLNELIIYKIITLILIVIHRNFKPAGVIFLFSAGRNYKSPPQTLFLSYPGIASPI